ncbi:MAG: ATP-dependent Clp protease proteolytic subunit, partial [Deltaproteobacteria bacterium]|nr:ATP-dependent Clp protease proteolytic subunit [Deltaproteobacteria bacterium]
ILLHQPLGGARGQATDIEIHAKEILYLRQKLTDIYVTHTGQDSEKIRRDTERDFYLSAKDAKDYGLIDEVVTGRKEAPKR